MMMRIAISLIIVFAACCGDSQLPVVPDPTVKVTTTPKPALENVDISTVPPLEKSRFQEGRTATGEPNHVAAELVANGKDAIPFLISKLDDETKIEGRVIPFWYELYVGDMALVILEDLFLDETEVNSTISGFGWDDFLERGGDKSLMGEEVLRRYIRKHGRKTIKLRWQQMWDRNRDRIFWDEKCVCFKLRN